MRNPAAVDARAALVLGGLLWIAALLTQSVEAQVVGACMSGFDWRVAPQLVDNAAGDKKIGARGRMEVCQSGHNLRRSGTGASQSAPVKGFPFSYHVEATGQHLLVPSGEGVPQGTEAAGRGGFSVSLSKPAGLVVCGEDEPEEDCALRMANVGPNAFDYGYIAITGHGKYEASAGFDEQAAALGVELRYWHLSAFVPSVLLTYDRVKPFASEGRDALSVGENWYGRLMIRGYWSVSHERLLLEVDAAAFKAHGLDTLLEEAGWKTGQYISATGGVNVGWEGDWIALESVSVTFADGQLPTASGNRRVWSVGVELGRPGR